ncbi:MAG: radical SAM protein [Promethearchaeota archaeon]
MRIIQERNVIKKNWQDVDLKIALCYPNKYHVGMSSLAIHVIQHLLNSRSDVVCERVFLPYTKAAPASLESGQPLKNFDIIGFSMQFETDYPYLIKMLLNSQIPPYAKDRIDKDFPLVIGGGPCISGNPEPIADFFDLFVVGDVEPVLDTIIDRFMDFKPPRKYLDEFLDIDGVYIPSLHQDTIKSNWVRKLDNVPHPLQQIVPLVETKDKVSPAFGKTFLVEVSRGCGHGCRFCLIGCTNRPYRERSLPVLKEIVDRGTKLTGVEKVSLIGAAISDYKNLEDLCWYIVNSGLTISISSLRADCVTPSLIEAIIKSGQKTLAIAPETGTNVLRSCINKGLTNDDILKAAEISAELGIHHLKLYYVVGLPMEERSDLEGIVSLTQKIADLKFMKVALSINPFVPKAHTPFQWDSQPPLKVLREKKKFLELFLRKLAPKIETNFLDFRWGKIQNLLSTGGRELSDVILTVAERPISLGSWRYALSHSHIDLEDYINRFSLYQEMPWDHILHNIRREFLIKERKLAENRRHMFLQNVSCN